MSKSKSEHKRLVAQGVDDELKPEQGFFESLDDLDKDLEETNKGPIRKAFSVDKIRAVGDAVGGWVMIEYHIRDNQIVEVKRTEPNLKSFAVNDFKKTAFHWWDKEVEL